MSWSVVVFTLDNSVEVVPSSWVVRNECFWPHSIKGMKLRDCIMQRTNPEDDWEIFKIRILKKYDDFKVATKKCEMARESDNLSSSFEYSQSKSSAPLIADLGKGCRTKKNKLSVDFAYNSSGNSSAEEIINDVSLPQLPNDPFRLTKSKQRDNNTQNILPQKDAVVENKKLELEPASSNSDPNLVRLTKQFEEFVEQTRDFQRLVLRNLKIISNQLKDNSQSIDTVLNIQIKDQEVPTEQETFEKLALFPIDSEENLLAMETFLNDPEVLNKIAKEFSKKGGDTVKELTRVIMRDVICDKVAALYSFEGFKKKKIFKNLNLYKLVIKSVRLNSLTTNATEKEISTVIKNWLPQASFRGKIKPTMTEIV